MGPKKNLMNRHKGQNSMSQDIRNIREIKGLTRKVTAGPVLNTQGANNTYSNFQAGLTGPSHKQNKLNKDSLQSMYKPTGRMTPMDFADASTPPNCNSSD